MADFYIFKTSFRDLLRAKRVLASLILIAVPAVIAVIWRFAARDEFDPYDAYNTLSSVVVYGFLLVILAVVFGTGVVSQEIEQKTIVYLLTRPVPRWRIMTMKFLAAVTGIVITVLAATLVLGAVTVWSGGEKSSVIRRRDVLDRPGLVKAISEPTDDVMQYLLDKMPSSTKSELIEHAKNPNAEAPPIVRVRQTRSGGEIRTVIHPGRRQEGYYFRKTLEGLNETLATDAAFYSSDRFPDLFLTPEIRPLVAEKPSSGPRLAKLNRVLL